jgi:hypothetical protein
MASSMKSTASSMHPALKSVRNTLRAPGFDLKGRGGKTLSEHWANGMRTLHGLHVHGFPNAFIVQPNQAANMISNVPAQHPRSREDDRPGRGPCRGGGTCAEVEPTEEAETAWVETILSGEGTMLGSTECTPGYYNNEGQGWSQDIPAGPGSSRRSERLLRAHREMARAQASSPDCASRKKNAAAAAPGDLSTEHGNT